LVSYCMRVSRSTTIQDIREKLKAFETLYGPATLTIRGDVIETGSYTFYSQNLKITHIGHKYLTVAAAEGVPTYLIDLTLSNHGVKEIVFFASYTPAIQKRRQNSSFG